MTAELRAALKTLAASVSAGAPLTITVPADQLLALLSGEPSQSAPSSTGAELLTVEQVAARLQVGKQYVYRRASRWSFTRRPGGRALRFDEAGFERWLARRTATSGASS